MKSLLVFNFSQNKQFIFLAMLLSIFDVQMYGSDILVYFLLSVNNVAYIYWCTSIAVELIVMDQVSCKSFRADFSSTVLFV